MLHITRFEQRYEGRSRLLLGSASGDAQIYSPAPAAFDLGTSSTSHRTATPLFPVLFPEDGCLKCRSTSCLRAERPRGRVKVASGLLAHDSP